MSDRYPDLPPSAPDAGPVPTGSPERTRAAAAAPAALLPGKWALLSLALSAAALASSVLLWQRFGGVQEELARRSLDASAQSVEARTLARQAQEGMLELSGRLAMQETRISEVSLQRTQLEELMQSLSRSRDENLVVDMESALRLAQQQSQLTGSAEPLIAALKSADQRLSRAAQPRLGSLQRAITRDLDRIKAATVTDVPLLMLKLDELVGLVDELPVANAMPASGTLRAQALPSSPAVSAVPASASSASWRDAFDRQAFHGWSQRMLGGLWDGARQLLRVSRIEQPEAALLAPEQSFFLRENLKLRLLNARLALLSRQTGSARADLLSANAWLVKYFDPTSRKTQTALELLAQVQGQLKTSELPRLDDTLTALATASAGR